MAIISERIHQIWPFGMPYKTKYVDVTHIGYLSEMKPSHILSLLFLLLSPVLFAQTLPLTYALEYTENNNWVSVQIQFPEPMPPSALIIPQSAPGTYELTRYLDYVDQVYALDPVGNRHSGMVGDGSYFQFPKANALTSISYRVNIKAMETKLLGAFASSKVRSDYLGVLGYSIFGFLEGTENDPIKLKITAPDNWPIYSTLAPKAVPEKGNLKLELENYAHLADAQLLMGLGLQIHEVKQAPIPLFVAAYAEAPLDIVTIGKKALDALNRLNDYFGFIPMPHYSLCYEFTKPLSDRHDYGFSIEHLNSMTASSAVSQIEAVATSHKKFRSMIHHMGHAWLPLRAYGQGYRPFDWQTAPLQDTIWLNEGFIWYVTTYYALDNKDLSFYRTIVDSAPSFIKSKSLKDLSLLGSTQYSLDFRIGKNLFARGALLAHELDQYIQRESKGEKALLDVILYLIARTEKQPKGFAYEQFPFLVQQATGIDCNAIWNRWQKP